MRRRFASILIPVALIFTAACGDDDGDECNGDSDCPSGSICTPAGVCAPDPNLQRCEADIDCSADAGLDDHLVCNTTTNRCEAPIVDGCPEQELV
ncbi:MAG: hypothetical protein IT379_07630, partial [Deltaproteobacteria bacterium]|nr:hypothetical protein [Deltaproteobacteria bacterium]